MRFIESLFIARAALLLGERQFKENKVQFCSIFPFYNNRLVYNVGKWEF